MVGKFQDVEMLGTTTTAQDDIRSSARRNSFFEPLNDTTGRPHREFHKTPPPPIIRGVCTSGALKQAEEEVVVDTDACLAALQGV